MSTSSPTIPVESAALLNLLARDAADLSAAIRAAMTALAEANNAPYAVRLHAPRLTNVIDAAAKVDALVEALASLGVEDGLIRLARSATPMNRPHFSA